MTSSGPLNRVMNVPTFSNCVDDREDVKLGRDFVYDFFGPENGLDFDPELKSFVGLVKFYQFLSLFNIFANTQHYIIFNIIKTHIPYSYIFNSRFLSRFILFYSSMQSPLEWFKSTSNEPTSEATS